MCLQRKNYFGFPFAAHDNIFDTELVSKVIYDLKGGKAPDLAELIAEHLQRVHSVPPVILSKFFFSVNCNGQTCAGLVWS